MKHKEEYLETKTGYAWIRTASCKNCPMERLVFYRIKTRTSPKWQKVKSDFMNYHPKHENL